MENYRKLCLQEQSALRGLLEGPDPSPEGIERFLAQHARLHSAQAVKGEVFPTHAVWSYEDALLADLSEAQVRHIPEGETHAIAWVLWHLARIEDATMNLLVAGREQVFNEGQWQVKIGSPIIHSGNESDRLQVAALCQAVDIPSLRSYRAEVGARTRQVVRDLPLDALPMKVDPARIERIDRSGVLVDSAEAIIRYWSRRTIAGLLLMPASRHILVHLNEALEIKNKLG